MSFNVTITDSNGMTCIQSVGLTVLPPPPCTDFAAMIWTPTDLGVFGGLSQVDAIYSDGIQTRVSTPAGNFAAHGAMECNTTVQSDGSLCHLRLSIIKTSIQPFLTFLDAAKIYVSAVEELSVDGSMPDGTYTTTIFVNNGGTPWSFPIKTTHNAEGAAPAKLWTARFKFEVIP